MPLPSPIEIEAKNRRLSGPQPPVQPILLAELLHLHWQPVYNCYLAIAFLSNIRCIVPEPIALEHLPFSKLKQPGYVYRTLLVEPPILLKRLYSGLKSSKAVTFKKATFANLDDVFKKVSEKIIINCTGLGSKEIWPDEQLAGIKGQLALLPPQTNLKYLFSGLDCHADGEDIWFQYMFPRSDAVVMGGTYQPKNFSGVNDKTCEMLIARMKKVFEGKQDACEGPPIPG
jgi:hypothetical protein